MKQPHEDVPSFDEQVLEDLVAVLVIRLRHELEPIEATEITLSRKEAALSLGILEGVAERLANERRDRAALNS